MISSFFFYKFSGDTPIAKKKKNFPLCNNTDTPKYELKKKRKENVGTCKIQVRKQRGEVGEYTHSCCTHSRPDLDLF